MEFHPYPHLIATLFNGCACGPPTPLKASSSWTWIGHPVSGLARTDCRPFRTRSPCGCRDPSLSPRRDAQLAGPFYKKYAVALPQVVLPPVVDTGFQVLFHSPPGVLFTFPSRYSSLSVTVWYLALGGGPPAFTQGSSCPALLRIPPVRFRLSCTGLSPSSAGFPKTVPLTFCFSLAVHTPLRKRSGLGSSAFARRYSRNRCYFPFLRVLRCFSSPAYLPCVMDWRTDP